MGKPESSLQRRMAIFFLVRVLMVMPMMCGPPEHALLRRCHGQAGQDKLEGSAGLVGAM